MNFNINLIKMNIVSVIDVASYILSRMKEVYKMNEVTTWKLQKLVYYCQVWHLIWHDRPLFDEDILAWINGPVCKELYEHHKGEFAISKIRGRRLQIYIVIKKKLWIE